MNSIHHVLKCCNTCGCDCLLYWINSSCCKLPMSSSFYGLFKMLDPSSFVQLHLFPGLSNVPSASWPILVYHHWQNQNHSENQKCFICNKIDIFCSVVPALQFPCHERLSANSLDLSAKMPSSYPLSHVRKEMRNREIQVQVVYWEIKHFPSKTQQEPLLFQLQCASEHCHEEGQCLMTTLFFACHEFPFLGVEESHCM